jgi:hypothetical protein
MRDFRNKKAGMPGDKFQTPKHFFSFRADNSRYAILQLTKTYAWVCRYSNNEFSVLVTNIISSE